MAMSFSLRMEFVGQVRPFLERNDPCGLRSMVRRSWPRERLVELLASDDEHVVKVAAICLGLTGTMAHCSALARVLYSDDAVAVQMAEHALWSIWLRSGDAESNRRLGQAIAFMNSGQFNFAVQLLTQLVKGAPRFAEAFNQRAIACYLLGRHAESAEDCERAIALNCHHFGAAASLGHCYAQLGRYDDALEAYYTALQIHPRMEGIRQSIQQLREMLAVRSYQPHKAPRPHSTA